jgi:hypothetical protein
VTTVREAAGRVGAMVARWAMTVVVVAGLLSVPVTCAIVDHPHSLFDMPAAGADHARHAAETAASHAAHAASAGRPPLAGAPALPPLHAGTVTAWLGERAGVASDAATRVPDALPEVGSASIPMTAGSLSALAVAIAALLGAVALLRVRPLAAALALAGHATAPLAPPPRPAAT